MPIKPYSFQGVSPVQQFAFDVMSAQHLPNPMQSLLEDHTPEDKPGFFKMVGLTAQEFTIIGHALEHVAYWPGHRDPWQEPWDPKDRLTPENLEREPWLFEMAMNGTLNDIESENQFEVIMERRRRDWENRQLIGQRGFGYTLLASIPSQIAEAYLGGVLLKPVQGVTKGVQAIRGARLAFKIPAMGGVAAGLNLGQEAIIQALDPDQPGDVDEALFMASAFGFAFGAAVPSIGAGVSGIGRTVSDARVIRMQRSVSEALAAPDNIAIRDQVVKDVAGLQEILDDTTIPTARTRGNRTIDDVLFLDDAGLDTVLREIDNEQIALLPPIIRDRLMPRLSDRARRLVQEAIDDLPADADDAPVRKIVARVINDMERRGEIRFGDSVEAIRQRRDFDAAGPEIERDVTVLVTPETKPLIEAIQKKHGDAVRFHEHPMQNGWEFMDKLERMDGILKRNEPADIGPVRGRIAALLSRGIPVGRLETPAQRAMRTPSGIARMAARTFFDFAWPTVPDPKDVILGGRGAAPAEGLLWNYHKIRDDALIDMDRALRDGIKGGNEIQYTRSDGRTVRIRSRVWHRREFYRAVADYLRQLDEHQRGQRPMPDAPKAIKDAAEATRRYTREMGDEALGVGLLNDLDTARVYLPRRWKQAVIIQREADFRALLVAQARKYREVDYWTGKRIDADTRTVIPEVVNFDRPNRGSGGRGLTPEERTAIREYADEQGVKLDELTEADIRNQFNEDILARYLEEVELWQEGQARATFETLTGIDNGHGIEHAFAGGGVFKNRKLLIDETEFAQFLDEDIDGIVGFYDRLVSGKVAARLAIKRQIGEWRPIVQELTGKDLVAEGYNPELIIQAVKEDFRLQRQAAAGNQKLLDAIDEAERRAVGDQQGVLLGKLQELEGRPVLGDAGKTVGWSLWVQRQALRIPYTAYLGKMTISAFSDLANMMFMKHLTPRHIVETTKALNILREAPLRRHLEGIYVATSDIMQSTRSLELGEVAALSDARPFGSTRGGRFLERSDAMFDWMARKFSGLTLMTRWNTNLKRLTATLVMDEIVHIAPKLAKARQLVDDGLGVDEALRRVGVSRIDADRLARLGFNDDMARRLTEKLDEHALDWEGNRVDSSHKGYISPEMKKWWAEDRELAEVFAHAVNAETMNIIVEPKMMSKPLANNKFMGKVFNQFQSFGYAWGAQLAPMAAQRSGYEILGWMMMATGLGAISDATHNMLTARRSYEDSIELWKEKPAGMMYAAILRGGLAGWLARPIGLMENTPFGIAKNLGNDQVSTMSARPVNLIEQYGPLVSVLNNLGTSTQKMFYEGQWNDRAQRQMWNALPFHNLWFLEGFNRLAEEMGYDTPIGPRPQPYRPDMP